MKVSKNILREKWVSVRGVPTYTLRQGSKKDHNTIIIIIPGNPGIAEYYADFMQELYKYCHLPIHCVSHAGHVTGLQQMSQYYATHDYLTLDGQIQHKLAYISDYVPAGKSLILIGHSIGCYMILKMLSNDTDNSLLQLCSCRDVPKCYLLFPTIERLTQTANGQFFVKVMKYFRWMILLATLLLLILPHQIKRFLVERHFAGQVPQCAVEATMKLLSPSSCRNCLFLANIEMQSVCKLDLETISENIERLCFYYGTNDAWCPAEFHHTLKRLFPSGEIHLCSHDIQHAFVLRNSKEMASIMSQWLQLNYT